MKKAKGMRKDSRIQVTLTIGRNEDGSPVRKSFYGKTRTEALAARDKYKKEREMGLAADGNPTVAEWVDKCLVLYRTNVNEHYVKEDAVPYRRLKDTIGKMLVKDVREADLQKVLNEFASGMSYSSVSKYYHAMKLVFSKARKNKLIIDDPSEDLSMPKAQKGTHRALEKYEVDCITQNWDKHRCGIWAMLMLLAGVRRGEMMALDWKNVDMENRKLQIREVAVVASNKTVVEERAKTDAGIRVIPICEPLYNCLNSVDVKDRVGFVCKSASGGPLSKSAYDRGWDSYNLKMDALLDNKKFSVRAHDLRHTFATALYDAGVDVKTAQYYLGHSDIRMTMDLYTHISKERESVQREKMITFLDDWAKKA